MPLPKVVQEQADRAEALRVQLFETQAQPTPAAPTPPAPAPEPQPTVAAPTPPAPPPVAQVDQSLEHRFSVLQGKYNAEVPRLNAQVRDLTRASEDKDSLIQQLREQLRANAKPAVSQEEIEQHGEGTVDLMRRLVQEQTAPILEREEALKAELARLKGGVTKSQVLGFYEILNRDHPDWAVVNADVANFHPWLDTVDPLVGETYQAILEDAQAKQDGARASAVFTAFKKARGSMAAAAASNLALQVVPSQGTAPVTPANPQQRRMFTRAEVNAHYDKLRRGGYANQGAADAAEAEIQLALVESRIQ